MPCINSYDDEERNNVCRIGDHICESDAESCPHYKTNCEHYFGKDKCAKFNHCNGKCEFYNIRNVMGYFDKEEAQDICKRMIKDGWEAKIEKADESIETGKSIYVVIETGRLPNIKED